MTVDVHCCIISHMLCTYVWEEYRERGKEEGQLRTFEESMGLIPAHVPGGIALNSAHLCNAFPSTSSTYKKKSVWPHKAKQKRFTGIQLIF